MGRGEKDSSLCFLFFPSGQCAAGRRGDCQIFIRNLLTLIIF